MTSLHNYADNPSKLPLVCICIPTYNAAATIRKTLDSILSQTYQNLIVHVSDNASTDSTLAVVKSLGDSRVRIHTNTKNIGAENNFNLCIQLAEGKYTGIFHADDIYEPDMVAQQVSFLEANPKTGALFTAATTIDTDGNPTGKIGQNKVDDNNASVYDFTLLLKAVLKNGNFLVCPSALVPTWIYKYEIQRWRGEIFRSSADLDVWLRIAGTHTVAILTKPLMRYRVDDKQFSNKVRNRIERADFFLVMDHYLAKPSVQIQLSHIDQQNYRQLMANDKLWRAINQFQSGNLTQARLLIRGMLNPEALHAAYSSKRGMLMLLTSLTLHLMIALRMKRIGNYFINMLRTEFNK